MTYHQTKLQIKKMKNKYKIDVENKLNRYEKNRYETLNYDLAELRNIIFTYREYIDKSIEIKLEKEILTMEREREKRFKKNLEKQIKKIHESNKYESTLNGEKNNKSYKSEYKKVDKNLSVNYNARCNVYKNIKCTKYVFKIEHSDFK